MKLTLDCYRLSEFERAEILRLLENIGDDLTVESLWGIIDQVWLDAGCGISPLRSECLDQFYRHPVWILNGIFIEQDQDSMSHRQAFAEAVATLIPENVVDIGGGFGTLSRLISKVLPEVEIDILEPYPSACAQNLVEEYTGIKFVNSLEDQSYDLLLCTDVLEHLEDPVVFMRLMVDSVKLGGHLLIANCFEPVVLCHLPSTFHLRYTFDKLCHQLGLKRIHCPLLPYGALYLKTANPVVSDRVLEDFEKWSKRLFPLRELKHRLMEALK